MKEKYFSCYISGRFDAFEGEVDVEKLVEKVCATVGGPGTPFRDVTMEVARKAIASEMDASAKVQWLKDNLDEIKELGGDTEKAWRLYAQGRTDALAHQLEEDVLEEIEEEDGDDEADEDDEDGEEGDDDNDDEEEDDEK